MGKRAADDEQGSQSRTATKISAEDVPNAAPAADNDVDGDNYEDPYGDDYESDGEIIELDSDEDDRMDDDQSELITLAIADTEKKGASAKQKEPEFYLPHRSAPVGPDEVLEADPSVYVMLHKFNTPWPCLTLDTLPDNLGQERRSYPASVYLATATQALKAKENELIMMKISSLGKTLIKTDESDDDSDDEDPVDPVMTSERLPLQATTNRMRVSPFAHETGEYLTALMQESGDVAIYDIGPQMTSFDTPGYVVPQMARRAVHTIRTHGNVEGYGLDWSPLLNTGALLTGDCLGRIHLTTRTTTSWVTDKTPFTASSDSIEDIQWSTGESTVFASGGCDGFIRIWDTRSKKHKPVLLVAASHTDINCISWSNKVNYLLASGHDDGHWGVWDLRNFSNNQTPSPVALYDFHKAAITAITFNPLDESIVAVSSEDNTVTLWDLAVEADDEEIAQQRKESQQLADIPPQLMFVHWQKEVKDVRWHKQIRGCLVARGGEGINIWKTISV